MKTFLRRRSRLCLELLEARCLPSTVTNLSDHDPGSLRDAIATTPDGGTVDFQAGLTGTIILTSGELAINENLTIEGPGASVITVSGNKASRVFAIANFTVAISGLTITDGSVTDSDGGGIYNVRRHADHHRLYFQRQLRHDLPSGGGILQRRHADHHRLYFQRQLRHCQRRRRRHLQLYGTLTITDSTFSGNSTTDGGGGICNDSIGTLTITDSTFSGNSASDGAAAASTTTAR